MTSKVIEIKSLSEHLFSCSLSVYCIHHLGNAKLGSPAFKALRKIGDKNFVPGLSQKVMTSSMKILAGRLFPNSYNLELDTHVIRMSITQALMASFSMFHAFF